MKCIGHQSPSQEETQQKIDGGMEISKNQPSQAPGESSITTVGCIRGSSRRTLPTSAVGVTLVVDPKNISEKLPPEPLPLEEMYFD